MSCFDYLPGRSLVAVAVALAIAGCSTDSALRQRAAEAASGGQYEQSLALLAQAKAAAPKSIEVRAAELQVKAQAVSELLGQAARNAAAGRYDEADAALQRVLVLEPASVRAAEALSRLSVLQGQDKGLAQARQLLQEGLADKALAHARQALRAGAHASLQSFVQELERLKRDREMAQARSTLGDKNRISLDFKEAGLRTVLDAIARNSGLNFIFDKDVRSDVRVSVYLKDASVDEALDLVTSTNQLTKKVLDSRTVLVYPNTPEKLKEYQEQVVRVFQLNSADAKAAAAFLKSMLKLRDPYVDERTNVLALREAPETIEMAERLLALFDAGEPEVVLEVEVLEVSSNKLTELGIKPPSSFSLTPLPPSGAKDFSLGNVGELTRSNIALGLPGATLNLRRDVGAVTTLANPKIRAKNKEKASVLIGDKIPVVSATTGNTGFVAETVTYLDVGLKLNVEPTVYPDDEVGIRINLEVSSLGTEVKTNSGSLAYQIGTRNASTLLRLKDGETQMLAGLISRDERMSSARVPGLGDIPALGRLLSNQRDTASQTELVLAITPRVLRNVRKALPHESELWVGTEAQPRLRPYGGLRELPTKPSAKPATPGSSDGPANRPPATTGSSAQTAAPSDGAPAQDATAPTADSEPKPVSPFTVNLTGPAAAKVGETVTVQVVLKDAPPARGLPVEVAYDPQVLEYVEGLEGDFFNQQGAGTAFSSKVDGPVVQVGVLRRQATTASGSGTLASLKFKALKPGSHSLTLLKAVPLTLGQMGEPVKANSILTLQVQ